MALQLEQELRRVGASRDYSRVEAGRGICADVVSYVHQVRTYTHCSFSTGDVGNDKKLQEGYTHLMAFNEPGISCLPGANELSSSSRLARRRRSSIRNGSSCGFGVSPLLPNSTALIEKFVTDTLAGKRSLLFARMASNSFLLVWPAIKLGS